MFFDYESEASCAACSGRCTQGYLPPQNPVYAKIARCHVSLLHLQSAIHKTWVAHVESGGAVPDELTAWLVEMARVLPRPVATIVRLYEAAVTALNATVVTSLAAHGAVLPASNHAGMAVELLKAVQLACLRGNPCAHAVRAFVVAVRPNTQTMEYLLLNALLFGACVTNVEAHLELLGAILDQPARECWAHTKGAVTCALRWSTAPARVLQLLFSFGIIDYSLPPARFDALSDAGSFSNSEAAFGYLVRWRPRSADMVDIFAPAVKTPYTAYAILYRRVNSLAFADFLQVALMLHEQTMPKELACGEENSVAAELLEILLNRPATIVRAMRVLHKLDDMFPRALRHHIPIRPLLYSRAGFPMQIALAACGVNAERCTLRWDFFTGDFLDIKLKAALVLAHYGVMLAPAYEQDPFYRLLINVITSRHSDAPWRFLQLCTERRNEVHNLPQFTELALRIMYLYNKSETASAPAVLDSIRSFGMDAVVRATVPLCTRFSLLRFNIYPHSCQLAINAFLCCLRRPGLLPYLPAEVILHILEAAPSASAFGRCLGPSDPGERFPLVGLEIELLGNRGVFGDPERIDVP